MLKLALRNLTRHGMRTALTLGAIASGVAALILGGGFVVDLLDQLAESSIHSRSGHVQVARRGYFEGGSSKPQEYLLKDPAAVVADVAREPGVVDVMGRLSFFGLLNNGRADLPVIGNGIEPDKERRLGTSLTIVAGRHLAAGDAFGVVVGRGVAHALKLEPGDRVTLLANTVDGAMNSLDAQVVGVFQTISKEYDARGVLLTLGAAQDLVGTRAINALVVHLDHTARTDAFAAALAKRLPASGFDIRSWQELDDFYAKTVDFYYRQFGALLLIILLMVLLGVANSVNMTAFERLSEFGTMRALGNRSRQVFLLVVTENVLLGIAGALLGVALGLALAAIVSRIGIDMPPPPGADIGFVARIAVDAGVVALAATVGLVAPVLASLWPALRVARVPVVEALRSAS